MCCRSWSCRARKVGEDEACVNVYVTTYNCKLWASKRRGGGDGGDDDDGRGKGGV